MIDTFFSYDIGANGIVPRRDLSVFFNRFLAITEDLFPGVPINTLRILDLGAYEGINSIGFAQLGAEVVSVEGREINFKKLTGATERLGLSNLRAVMADVRTITEEQYGRFDLVLACGIMYHLDEPSVFEVTENVAKMTKRAAIIDTHTALTRPERRKYRGNEYWGMTYAEFAPGTPMEQKNLELAQALDNNKSFWLTRVSWMNLLKHLSFATVYESVAPFVEGDKAVYGRATFVAVKNDTFKPFFPVDPSDALIEQVQR